VSTKETTLKGAKSDLDTTALVRDYFSPEVQAALQRLLEAVQADEHERCVRAATVIVNRYHPGQAEAIVGREIVRAIREAGKR